MAASPSSSWSACGTTANSGAGRKQIPVTRFPVRGVRLHLKEFRNDIAMSRIRYGAVLQAVGSYDTVPYRSIRILMIAFQVNSKPEFSDEQAKSDQPLEAAAALRRHADHRPGR